MLQNLNRHYVEPVRSFNHAARLFLIMTIIYGVIYTSWQLFFNFYMLQSGYTREFLGLVNSMPWAGGLVFGIPAGRLSDRIGRKPSLIIGVGFFCLFLLAQVIFRQPVIIVASAFLSGIFSTLFLVSEAPLMMKLSNPENRTMLFSLNFGLQTVSGAVSSLFAGQLPTVFGALLSVPERSATAYQAVLITGVLVGSLSILPLLLMKEPGKASPSDSSAQKATGLVLPKQSASKISSALSLTIAKMAGPQIVIGFGAAILIPYMNVFFKDRFNISDSLLGLLFSLSALLIGIGSVTAPRLSTRLGGKVRGIVATQTTSLLFLLLMGFSPFLWLSSVGFLMRSALMNMSAPLYTAFCMERAPEQHQGLVNSILNISWNIGWAVGPYISGVVQENYGFEPLFITTAVLYALAIALTWIFFRGTETAEMATQNIVQSPEFLD
jgi:MFS family permease